MFRLSFPWTRDREKGLLQQPKTNDVEIKSGWDTSAKRLQVIMQTIINYSSLPSIIQKLPDKCCSFSTSWIFIPCEVVGAGKQRLACLLCYGAKESLFMDAFRIIKGVNDRRMICHKVVTYSVDKSRWYRRYDQWPFMMRWQARVKSLKQTVKIKQNLEQVET